MNANMEHNMTDMAWLVCKCGAEDRAPIGDYVTKGCNWCGRVGCWVEYTFDPDLIRRQSAGLKELFAGTMHK